MLFRFRTHKTNDASIPDPAVAVIHRWLVLARLGLPPTGQRQRRRRNRWRWTRQLCLMTGSGERIRVRVTDLSACGMGFHAPCRLKPGEQVRLAEKPTAATWVPARVVYAREQPGRDEWRIGAEFVFANRGENGADKE